ncbi:MAG TPA: RodZ domain-containing protein [Burkholderiales bacterium]|nr:RodZ domain-containing protein [Burkholderiales bacterium]
MTEGAADNQTASIGRVLSAARERQGLSVSDVARQLKLAVRQVEALEADDFKSLPRITFVRGFIRNYAKLVQVDVEPLLKAAKLMPPPPQVPEAEHGVAEIPTTSDKKYDWRSYAISGVLAALLAGFFAYEWYHGKLEKDAPKPVNVKREPAPAAVEKSKTETPRKLITEPVPAPPDLAQSSAAAAAQQTDIRPVAPRDRGAEIRLEFVQDTWVEIADKNGKAIFSQLNPAGSTQSVRGVPPFSVVVGNAAGVRIIYNNKPVDLKPYTKVDVARLTLE